MHQSGRPVWSWRETLALPRPQKIIRPAHTPLKSDFYNKIGQEQTSCLCEGESVRFAVRKRRNAPGSSMDRLIYAANYELPPPIECIQPRSRVTGLSWARALPCLRLIVEKHVQQGTVDFDAAVVINKTHLQRH